MKDHELRVLVDAAMFLATKHAANRQHRGISNFVRHLISEHLASIVDEEAERDTRESSLIRGVLGKNE